MNEEKMTREQKFLFVGCFIALVATSFGFISRAFMLGDWQQAFDLTETQKGEIFGAGLWPFAISIVLFSLVIDRIGYRNAMWFAFITQFVSAIMTIFAKGYISLYLAAFVGALGAGTVEAVINPAIATMFPKAKTKWLNILHAGWPGGLMLAGILTIALGRLDVSSWNIALWQIKVALILIPVVIYGAMIMKMRFPLNERVAAGVSYKEMLAEPGAIGIFIPTFLILQELGRVIDRLTGANTWALEFDNTLFLALTGASLAVSAVYGMITRSLGRGLYILMLVVMLLLATTELGTDGWIQELTKPAMTLIGYDSGWVLVYTALIMTILRFCTGPILRITRFTPLGLLSFSCIMVIIGLVWLSKIDTAAKYAILIAATIYGAGQCFFWPTTLGFISERFPAGGALSLNAIGGVGMLGVGILGGPWLGYIQDTTIENELKSEEPALYAQVIGEPTASMFGEYHPIDQEKIDALDATEREDAEAKLTAVRTRGKSDALFKVAILPLLMLITYWGLLIWFRTKGGYRAVELAAKNE